MDRVVDETLVLTLGDEMIVSKYCNELVRCNQIEGSSSTTVSKSRLLDMKRLAVDDAE